METPPTLPRSLRSRIVTAVVEALFVAYLGGALLAAFASALLAARACYLAFGLWPGFAFVAGVALQGCKLGTLLFAEGVDRRVRQAACGLLVALSLVASCAAVAGALALHGAGAVAVGLLIAAAVEATVAGTFLSLRPRAEAALSEGDVLDGVAREAATAFRRQEARHAALRHDAAGHVQAIRTGLRGRTAPEGQASAPRAADPPVRGGLGGADL